jgi:cytochrome P450 family 142 subfamily A polypeptide 1
MEQLLAHPDQKQRLIDDPDRIPVAVEEMIRWVSPIKNMNRTLTRDIELHGERLREGDKVLLLYESANFDDAHFVTPERFDVARSPNDHLAFGFGAHFCLGASLARLEISAMIGQLLRRLPDLELATDEPPARTITGIAQMPVRFGPAPATT